MSDVSDVHMPVRGAGHFFCDFYGLFSNGDTPISWDMEPL